MGHEELRSKGKRVAIAAAIVVSALVAGACGKPPSSTTLQLGSAVDQAVITGNAANVDRMMAELGLAPNAAPPPRTSLLDAIGEKVCDGAEIASYLPDDETAIAIAYVNPETQVIESVSELPAGSSIELLPPGYSYMTVDDPGLSTAAESVSVFCDL